MNKMYVDEEFEVNIAGEAEDAIANLAIKIAKIKMDGWRDLALLVCGDEYDPKLMLRGIRPETDTEYKQRLVREEGKRAEEARLQVKEQELRELARLKAKYENDAKD